MKKIVDRYTNNIFENIKHMDEYGNEYWYARELSKVLEYRDWRNFLKVLNKAKEALDGKTGTTIYKVESNTKKEEPKKRMSFSLSAFTIILILIFFICCGLQQRYIITINKL